METNKQKELHPRKNVYTVETIPIGTKTAKELIKEILTSSRKVHL